MSRTPTCCPKQRAVSGSQMLILGEGESLMNEFPERNERFAPQSWVAGKYSGWRYQAWQMLRTPWMRASQKSAYKRWLAAQVTVKFVSESSVSQYLPYSLGQAIGGAMPIASARRQPPKIKIPPADFVIDLDCTRLHEKRRQGETANTIDNTYIFGLGCCSSIRCWMKFILMTICSSLRVVERTKLTAFRSWESFERLTVTSVRSLFDQFSEPNQKWAQMYVNNLKDKKTSWKKVSKAFQRVEADVFAEIRGD